MKILLRAAAVLAFVQFVAHGSLLLSYRPSHGQQEIADVGAMRSHLFDFGGARPHSYWEMYIGYGLFAALSLAIPLSVPSERWPLLSLPRFGLTIFPLFLALAIIGGRPRAHTAIVAVSSLLLGVSVAQWALWQWVA